MPNDIDVVPTPKMASVTTFKMTAEFRERLTAAAGDRPLAVFIREAIEAHIDRTASLT